MNPELKQLLRAPFEIAPLSPELVVYGAGNTGRVVAKFLTSLGYKVLTFLDAAARPDQMVQGIPVHRPADWSNLNKAASYDMLIAIHNFGVDMVSLQEEVQGMGFRRTLNMVDFQNLFPVGQPWRYWLAPRSFYIDREAEIEAAAALFGDDISRRWFTDVLSFRLTGDYRRLPPSKPADQYAPADLPRWSEPMRFIDCGAYNGDTIKALARVGYAFDAIAAFEPDPANFVALAERSRNYGPSFCFPCGVADSTRQVRFQSGDGMGSHESDDGNVTIQCVAIDEALAGFNPTYIKMDIEGAEIDALHGARNTIAESRPSLAISLYHQPEHFWQIPLLISGWDLGYRFELRGHSHGSFDTVLYAYPSGSPGRMGAASRPA